MIQTFNLSKQFGRQKAVENLNLTIKKGEIYGFLGPNGAGKTTTIRMLLGLTVPTSGEIHLFGSKLIPGDTSYRKRIGVVPEKHPRGMWKWMTSVEYLQLFSDMYGVKGSHEKINRSLERLQLSEHKNKKISQFSRGMMQKLSFARALIHNPDILLLDEPISGLDPIGIRQIHDIILEEHKQGKTIFLSSHLLTEIEKFCTRIGIIYEGSLVSEDSTKNIIGSLALERMYRIDVETISDEIVTELQALDVVKQVRTEGNSLYISVEKEGDHRKTLSQFLYSKDSPPLLIQEQTNTLEDAFISITSKSTLLKQQGKQREGTDSQRSTV